MKPRALLVTGCAVLLSAVLAACSSGSVRGGAPASTGSPPSSANASSGSGASSASIAGKTIPLVYVPDGMPYFGVTNGKLDGVDGALLDETEQQLGVKFAPSSAQFPAFLAGVQSGRYGIGVGGVAWTKERAATGLFTDPVYYSPVVVMCKKGLHPSTVNDLKGHSVGASAGTIQEQGLRGIKGVDTHTYPSSQNALQDLISGRLDCVSDDTLIVAYVHLRRPDLQNFDITTIKEPTAAEIAADPPLANFKPYMVAWYLTKGEESLVAKLNTVIDSWYKSGFTAKVLAKWGVTDPKSLLTPIPAFDTDRRGVDRPATWNAPTATA